MARWKFFQNSVPLNDYFHINLQCEIFPDSIFLKLTSKWSGRINKRKFSFIYWMNYCSIFPLNEFYYFCFFVFRFASFYFATSWECFRIILGFFGIVFETFLSGTCKDSWGFLWRFSTFFRVFIGLKGDLLGFYKWLYIDSRLFWDSSDFFLVETPRRHSLWIFCKNLAFTAGQLLIVTCLFLQLACLHRSAGALDRHDFMNRHKS